MKLKKILSLAAAAVATSVVATTASADFTAVPDAVGGLSSATGLYMVPIFCNAEGGDIPLTDYGLDLSKVGGVAFTLEVPEDQREFFNGSFGGGIGASIHMKGVDKLETVTDADKTYTTPGGKKTDKWSYYNWDSNKEYWGVIDPGAKDPDSYDVDGNYIEGLPEYIVMAGDDKPAFMETLAPYTYRIKTDIVNPVVDGACKAEDITDIRVFLQGWGGGSSNYWGLYTMTVTRTAIFDTDGKVMIAFDEKGNKVDGTADDEKEPVRPVVPEEGGDDNPPATSDTTSAATSEATSAATSEATSAATSEATSAATSSAATSSAATSSAATSNTTSAATSNTTSAATSNTTSAATSNTATSTATSSSSSEGGLPTGAIVGIIAGVVAVVVVVVAIVVKKKKG